MHDTASQFQMLRARVESSMKPPYVLLVSSALANDGKDVCAHGLAQGMSAAGYRTLLIELDHDVSAFKGLSELSSLASAANAHDFERAVVTEPSSGTSFLSLSNPNLRATCSMENVAAFLAFARSTYAAVVIDAAPLAHSSIGTLFAAHCDAVIVAAREGRSIRPDDRELVDVIERESINFFGVVTIGRRQIADFAKRTFASGERYASNQQATVRSMDPSVKFAR